MNDIVLLRTRNDLEIDGDVIQLILVRKDHAYDENKLEEIADSFNKEFKAEGCSIHRVNNPHSITKTFEDKTHVLCILVYSWG